MTDDRLRALERRFRETGSVEDEAAWRMGMKAPTKRKQGAWLLHYGDPVRDRVEARQSEAAGG